MALAEHTSFYMRPAHAWEASPGFPPRVGRAQPIRVVKSQGRPLCSRGSCVAAGLLIGLFAFLCSGSFAAALYRCMDASGASVFTDSPVQLDHCEAIESHVESSTASPSTAVPGPPPRIPVPPYPSQAGVEANPVTAKTLGRITVPVERIGHLLIVSTQVNGSRAARLILDTGASHTILSHDVAGDLGLLSDPQTRFVTLKTAGGPVQAEIVRVNSLSIADAEVHNSLVAVYDMPDAPDGVDGLLGLTFLKEFRFTLDTAQGLLHLQRPER